MKDIWNTKHEHCGGTFLEINIREDIACDKCGEPSDRYLYTQAEIQAEVDLAKNIPEPDEEDFESEVYALRAARISYANLFDGDVDSIHENIRKLQKEVRILREYHGEMV